MADTKVSNFTAGATINATDRMYAIRSPFGAGDDRYVLVDYFGTYFAKNTLAAGTLTTSQPMTLTQTWNDAGVTFRGLEIVITDTASAAGSTAFRVLGGAAGTAVFWSVSKDGHLLTTDNTYDIGASGATRPRNIYASASITAGATISGNQAAVAGAGYFNFSGRGYLQAPSNGVWSIVNEATTGFTGLLLGPSGTTYNRLKHNAAGVLELRLADDSAQATWDALAYRAAGTKVVGVQGAAVTDASGGAVIDSEARTAINALLARLRTHGLIAT